VIAERLQKLAEGAAAVQQILNAADEEIVDGEVVEDSTTEAAQEDSSLDLNTAEPEAGVPDGK
jgi:hypothetical protein